MNAAGWLALAAAAGLLRPPAQWAARAAPLATAGRLAAPRAAAVPGGRAGPARGAGAAVAVAGVVGVLLAAGVLLAVAVAVVVGVGWLLRRDAAHRRERAARQAELRAAVRALIGELEAGAAPPAALAAAGAIAPRYAAVLVEAASAAAAGGDPGEALLADDDTRAIGLAWQVAADTGLALAGVLGRIADDLRAEHEQRRAVDAGLAGPRASALLLSGLPLIGIALGSAMGARPLAVLTGTSGGRLLCCAGVLLDAAGLLWMRRILARAERA
ncbi:MAG: tight adherence protein [Pseudonocardiales bacterium]|nr:tight adherence protein [Pseudonocardiales bacterium]